MLRQGTMARLAGNVLVDAFALHLQDVSMATLANLVTGVGDRKRRDLADCVAAIVSVLSKTARDEQATRDQKQREPYHEDGGEPKEMFRILETFHSGKKVDLLG